MFKDPTDLSPENAPVAIRNIIKDAIFPNAVEGPTPLVLSIVRTR